MAIKKLQNNFTTPEQSKRLLELGVPADSADLYYQNALDARIIPAGRLYKEYTDSLTGLNREIWYFKPCWSVGRLIEIYYKVCINPADPLQKWMNIEMGFYGLVEQMILRFVHDRDKLDFSKYRNR